METTTGPLGQGFGNGVGMAMAQAHLAARYNRPGFEPHASTIPGPKPASFAALSVFGFGDGIQIATRVQGVNNADTHL